jgi:hypothetical protein
LWRRGSRCGDDRMVWIDPHDSKHVLKADDGGVGMSYDRGVKWIYVTSLPVSQWYHVAVDMRKPYWVWRLRTTAAGGDRARRLPGRLERRLDRTCAATASALADPNDDTTFYSESQHSASFAATRSRASRATSAPTASAGSCRSAGTGARGGRPARKSRSSATRWRPRTGTARSSCRPSIRRRSTPARTSSGRAPTAATRGRRSAT